MKILIIDDDKVFAEPLLWQLKQDEHEITFCRSVENVLDRERKMKVPVPELLLLDVLMPHGDRYSRKETDAGKDTGLKLLKDIQNDIPDVPIIIITVRQDLDLIKLQKEFGDNIKEILVKPVNPTEVIDAINQIRV